MNFDHEQRFERIVSEYLERPAGDYAELLQRGYVTSPPGVDPDQWRAEIRAQARKDKIRVTTIRDGDRAIAARKRVLSAEQESEELRYELERHELLRSLKHAAEELGHEIRAWVRNDRESITSCSRCGARIYVCLERPPVTTARQSANRARPRSGPDANSPFPHGRLARPPVCAAPRGCNVRPDDGLRTVGVSEGPNRSAGRDRAAA